MRDGRGRPLRHSDAGEGALRIALRKGDSALITARGDRPDLTIAPVRPNAEAPRWGLPAELKPTAEPETPRPCPA
ncbi:hypothetical protein ABIE67_007306 [Streptomyces sp. V4I8]|uniref:hypothetical protein n=1 Tax=Streptomyces sp. V4I8 TaxID=3156469 RepID=UPI003512E807